MTEKPARKRRWPRFSLKMLLIVFVLLSLPLGWLAKEVVRAERQRRAVEAIEKAGGSVTYDYEISDMVPSRSEPPAPAWLRELAGDHIFSDVAGVFFDASEVGREDLDHLKHLTKLRVLNLASTQVTDGGLAHLQGLKKLEWLELPDTLITDAGLEHLRGLTNLGGLHLSRTQVTDAGLEHLQGLKKLEWLNLSGTQVTEEGMKELREALPNCYIRPLMDRRDGVAVPSIENDPFLDHP